MRWWTLLWLMAGCVAAQEQRVTEGPMVGHVDSTSARVWVRMSVTGPVTLSLRPVVGADAPPKLFTASAEKTRDRTAVFHARGLAAGTAYHYEVRPPSPGRVLARGRLKTAPEPGTSAPARIAFGSCANHWAFKRLPIFTRIATEKVDALVLLGDTPYIDSVRIDRQRKAYRTFYRVPSLAALMRTTPTYATWDDHDFGRNEATGLMPGKRIARHVFGEYHAQSNLGNGKDGIYTSFRHGPVEVFLLDTRWFADTEPFAFGDPKKKTLLGKAQWTWLKKGLRESTATFKILASGMVWNGNFWKLKRDHWGTWEHEREHLFAFLGKERVNGVVLVGGDVHRSRAYTHDTDETVGYDLTELVASPLANFNASGVRPLRQARLLHDAAEHHMAMIVSVDASPKATLVARCINQRGKVFFTVRLAADTLRRRR